MADYRSGSRFLNSDYATFRGKNVVFPHRVDFTKVKFPTSLTIISGQEYRPDLLSLEAYGRADLGWYLMSGNKIDDIADLYVGRTLRVPEL